MRQRPRLLLTTSYLLPRHVAVGTIRLYQATLSPDHGWLKALYPAGYCPFLPSCSEYTKQAIQRYGIVKGGILGAKRVVRCNPWGTGGHDPVPTAS